MPAARAILQGGARRQLRGSGIEENHIATWALDFWLRTPRCYNKAAPAGYYNSCCWVVADSQGREPLCLSQRSRVLAVAGC
jgi:hypothetical protein